MKQGIWFLAVGALASGIHLVMFWLLNEHWLPSMPPEISNSLAFLIAFSVSFLGHRFLSFPGARISMGASLVRFGLSALAGFLTNQIAFIALTRGTGLWPTTALAIALVLAAGQTYLLGRYWAFRR